MRRLPLRSPPRVRGKVCESQGARHDGGSIPAYAGKSHPERRGADQCGDHPRVCGEKCLDGIAHGMIAGSPPRMRGKAHALPPWRLSPGITPAYAGKSCSSTGRAGGRGDHPRVCGEKIRVASPRITQRGKDHVAHSCKGCVGSTPAYAGKSLFCFTAAVPIQDHPRVCGEKIPMAGNAPVRAGSPPRMRRKGTGSVPSSGNTGITPAYAGKRSPARLFLYLPGDHPRVCGEKARGTCA